MNITLDPATQKLIEEQMRRGGYSTPNDVVRAGLASLEQQVGAGDFEAGEMDELLAQGERSGGPLDGETVLAELRELRKQSTQKAG